MEWRADRHVRLWPTVVAGYSRVGGYLPEVAIWDADAETLHPVDYRLVKNTFVTMFWRRSILDETVEWLVQHDYDVVTVDAGSWTSSLDMLDDLAQRLDFPEYFGRNLDALNDCIRDVASGDYGRRADGTGLVFVLTAFDAFAKLDPKAAQALLDILAGRARSAILTGNRLICLVQSNDPRLGFAPVGAMPVVWNDAEWLNSKRGL
jgi:Barstar (barnase inhibitor)